MQSERQQQDNAHEKAGFSAGIEMQKQQMMLEAQRRQQDQKKPNRGD
jgi:hypothetical protein